MSFEPAVRLTEQIADHLGTEIITGRLKPQARIQELKVASDLSVSRGSVREALLILESRHLIEIIPRRGAVVSSLDVDQVDDFSELFSELLCQLFVKVAASRSRRLDEFKCSMDSMELAVVQDDFDSLVMARCSFIRAGFPILNTFYLSAVLSGLIPTDMRLAHVVSRHPDYDMRDTLRYHQALLEAVRGNDVGRIVELVHAHSGREKKLVQGLHRPSATRPVVGNFGRSAVAQKAI
ncbi:MAG: GntR family transcriptional regulator [Gammaproteobacteria bacterium]|nr:GntR family transcriptional regulator [Gammaproteobacteria bacterium]MCZ6854493.1 GntR family transcriptional regulator [Gammaproteobacteria bacterium]